VTRRLGRRAHLMSLSRVRAPQFSPFHFHCGVAVYRIITVPPRCAADVAYRKALAYAVADIVSTLLAHPLSPAPAAPVMDATTAAAALVLVAAAAAAAALVAAPVLVASATVAADASAATGAAPGVVITAVVAAGAAAAVSAQELAAATAAVVVHILRADPAAVEVAAAAAVGAVVSGAAANVCEAARSAHAAPELAPGARTCDIIAVPVAAAVVAVAVGPSAAATAAVVTIDVVAVAAAAGAAVPGAVGAGSAPPRCGAAAGSGDAAPLFILASPVVGRDGLAPLCRALARLGFVAEEELRYTRESWAARAPVAVGAGTVDELFPEMGLGDMGVFCFRRGGTEGCAPL
jgi:hypothetical protein